MAGLGSPPKEFKHLFSKLKAVHPGLAFEMGRSADQVMELTISADGVRSNIPHVNRLVDAAPEIPGWRVFRFRQASGGHQISMHGESVTVDDVAFQAFPAGGQVHLKLFIKGYEKPNDLKLGLLFLLFDQLLGEYDAMTVIGQVEAQPFEAAEGQPNVIWLESLPAAVAEMREEGLLPAKSS